VVTPPRRPHWPCRGDKSISHRAVLLLGAHRGRPRRRIHGFRAGRARHRGDDSRAVRSLGIHRLRGTGGGPRSHVFGQGLRARSSRPGPFDRLRPTSGTPRAPTCRGILGGPGNGAAVRGSRGDASLRKAARYEGAFTEAALPAWGAGRRGRTTGPPAASASRGGPLHSITYELPVASAQVKSRDFCSPGLYAKGETTVRRARADPRTHTEFDARGGRRCRSRVVSGSVTISSPPETARAGVRSRSRADFLVRGSVHSSRATLVPGSGASHPRLVNLNPPAYGPAHDPGADWGARVDGLQPPQDQRGSGAGDLEVRLGRARRDDGCSGTRVPLANRTSCPLFFALAASLRARQQQVCAVAEELRAKEVGPRSRRTVDALRAPLGPARSFAEPRTAFRIKGVPEPARTWRAAFESRGRPSDRECSAPVRRARLPGRGSRFEDAPSGVAS